MSKGIIYLIQPAQLIGTDRYKIGMSNKDNLDRCNNGYLKNTRYISINECTDPLILEKELKICFNEKFKLIAGSEYFGGNEIEMLELFMNKVLEHRKKHMLNPIKSDEHDKNIINYTGENMKMFENILGNKLSVKSLAELFVGLKKNSFVHNARDKILYYINQHGIFCIDEDECLLKQKLDIYFTSAMKKEFINNNNSVNKLKSIYNAILKYYKIRKNKILNEVKLLYTIDRIYEKMDTINPNLVGFDNGVYDISSGEFRDASPDEYISVTTGYNYQKADPVLKKEAMKLLETIFPNQKELRYVLKHISLGLYGANPEEKFYIWIGTGGNGKGLLRDIIQIVLGAYCDSIDISYLYKSNIIRSDAANPVMAKKKNSRLVISTEPEGDVTLKSSIIKTLSGNDPQQVRGLYAEPFNYIPKFKLIIQCNSEPVFHGFDGGMKRRPNLIRFPNKFVDNPKLAHERKIDKTLKKKIITDKKYMNEFFEIFADHYKLYLREGMILPERFENDTKQFIRNNDPVGEWLESNIDITNRQTDVIRASSLYSNYMQFMQNDNRGITQLSLKNILSDAGIRQKKKMDGNYYIGIQLKVDAVGDNNNDDNVVRNDEV